MKKLFILILGIGLSGAMQAQKQNPAYLDYIAQWKETAVQQQADYGVPASIIMAQALLESAAGQSELALNARNHFALDVDELVIAVTLNIFPFKSTKLSIANS